MSSHQFAYAQKRRSTRVDQAVPLVVQGVGALREPYQEQVSTLSVSCHGCVYQSKHEVIQGETVYLDVKIPTDSLVGYSSKARVKWAQKLGGKERVFQIAVELEIAGNIWGIVAPPADWFPVQVPAAMEAAAAGRELKLVMRKEQPIAAGPDGGINTVAHPDRKEVAKVQAAPLAQLMVGLGEQIQSMAAEAAASALFREKSRLLEEFRAQLREETIKTIQSAVASSKEVIVRQAVKELNDAHEVGVRGSYAQWMKKVQQDMESARQHLLNQGKEVSQRLDGMALSAIERVQRNMESSRTEAVDRFVSRLREQVMPMIAEAKESLQKLQGAEIGLRKESEAIFAGLENQLACSTNEILEKSQEDLEKNGAAIAARARETLLKLSRDFEKAARENANTLFASMGSQLTKALQEKAAETSREFSAGLESYTRSYLESIGKSIAEIPRNTPGSSRQ